MICLKARDQTVLLFISCLIRAIFLLVLLIIIVALSNYLDTASYICTAAIASNNFFDSCFPTMLWIEW